MTITLEAIRAAGGIVHSDGNIFFRDISMLQGLAGAAPAAVAPQGEYPHEQMDAMALARYKVVPSHESMLWSHAVVAGDGAQQLYVGREVECQNMARKFAGAFLDGAFAFHSIAAAPALEAPAAPAVEALRALMSLVRREAPHLSGKVMGEADAILAGAALAAAPQAPAAPSADALEVIENLLQLARIVDRAVEDWGESFADGSCEVCFHKEEADKMEAILEFFDGLPDAPAEEGVIESGPLRAARVLRAMAAPAAPAVDDDPLGLRDVGEALVKTIAENSAALDAAGWTGPMDCPSEIVVDLLNLLEEANTTSALGEWVATLEVDSEGGLDYETVPPCTLPPGCYPLYRAAQAKEGGAA